ncbi:hypothetical protein [Thalassovita sp.]|uniref:hypothetical protein n=1 Tax=Thalassovita sp. TaxID=1979401 RepID=UPI002882A82F|nr:hypothetical protein [Thalassovita sp.]MDF1801725.1 hypothetical protein [Thalassovita sp.]
MSGSGAALRGDFLIVENAGRSDEARWTLRFDFNALCDFEAETGLNALDFIAKVDEGADVSASHLRTLFWSALAQVHPEASFKDAGRLMSQNPEALSAGLAAGLPDPTENADEAPGN